MVNCPYLKWSESKGCVNCLGWRCTAGSREKKLSDVSMCQNESEWIECPKYLSKQPQAESFTVSNAIPSEVITFNIEVPVSPTTCPYLGEIPPEGCCSATCHAKGVRVAVRKCRDWEMCTRYLIAKFSGIPFRGGG